MRERRTRFGMAAVLVAAVLVTACSVEPIETAKGDGAADAAACTGPSTARSEGWVKPIAKAAVPAMPTTITDFTGEEQTIRSANRILALDTYGTLATTVYALGL